MKSLQDLGGDICDYFNDRDVILMKTIEDALLTIIDECRCSAPACDDPEPTGEDDYRIHNAPPGPAPESVGQDSPAPQAMGKTYILFRDMHYGETCQFMPDNPYAERDDIDAQFWGYARDLLDNDDRADEDEDDAFQIIGYVTGSDMSIWLY